MMEALGTGQRWRAQLNPVLVILAMVVAAVLLTHLIPAGRFEHHGKKVVAGTYQVLPKENGLTALVAPTAPTEADRPARAAGVVALFASIPAGMTKSASLLFMVMFVGGMFGVLKATNAIDAAIDRLLHATAGNVYLLTAGVMLMLACGSTFLGLVSEYLAILPLVVTLGERLRLPRIYAPAVVAIAGWVGYAASVTNPIVLAVAQPLAAVPIFSGILPRFLMFLAMFAVGLSYMFVYLRRIPKVEFTAEPAILTTRQVWVLVSLVAGGAGLIIGTGLWLWQTTEHAAAFIALGVLLAIAGGLRPSAAADAFLEGMKGMLLPAVMIGLASSIAILLESSQVLDSIVQGFALMIEGHSKGAVAGLLMISEMMFDVLLQSTSAKAAISLPILAPIAQLSGVGGQVSVTALTLGSGLTNLITPTNGVLLAILALSGVSYGQWLRFIAPLFALLSLIGFGSLLLMTMHAL